jgi:hypothetical protein
MPHIATTAADGTYAILGLPADVYVVTFTYGDLRVERTGVVVRDMQTTPVFQRLELHQPACLPTSAAICGPFKLQP